MVRLIRSHIQRKIVEWPPPRLCSPTGAAILQALLAPPAADGSIGFTSSALASQMSRTSSRGKPGLNTSAFNAASRCRCHTPGFLRYDDSCYRPMLSVSRAGCTRPLRIPSTVCSSARELRGHAPMIGDQLVQVHDNTNSRATADIIFTGGQVHTVNTTNDIVEAVAVGGGRIL